MHKVCHYVALNLK